MGRSAEIPAATACARMARSPRARSSRGEHAHDHGVSVEQIRAVDMFVAVLEDRCERRDRGDPVLLQQRHQARAEVGIGHRVDAVTILQRSVNTDPNYINTAIERVTRIVCLSSFEGLPSDFPGTSRSADKATSQLGRQM